MGFAKGNDGRARSVKNPLEGSVGDADLNDLTLVTLSVSTNIATGNILTDGYCYANGTPVSFSGITYGNSNVVALLASFGSNTISTTGNITTGNILTNGYYYANGTPVSFDNSTYSNSNVVSLLSSFGSNSISTTGNITGGNILGNGSHLTGLANVAYTNDYNSLANTPTIPTNTTQLVNGNGFITSATANVISVNSRTGVVTVTEYSNAAVAAYLPTYSGNLTAGNIGVTGNATVGNILTNGYYYSNGTPVSFGSTYGNSNVVTLLSSYGSNTISTTGNVTAGNLITTGNILGNVLGYSIGYRDIPQVSLAANTTISTSDAGKHYYSTSASNLALTIANNSSQAFQVGATINIINQGSANVSVLRGTGVTMYLAGNSTSSDRTLTSYGVASITKVSSDTWFISGVGLV